MPEQSFDTNTVPKPPILTYVSVGAKPSKELAALVGKHCHPRDRHNADAVAKKGKRPERRAHDMSAPERSVVVVSHLCASQDGRHQLVIGLRSAGLSPQHASMLGFATTVPKGVDEQTLAGKARPVFGKPAKPATATADAAASTIAEDDPTEPAEANEDKPKRGRGRSSK